MNRYRDMTIDRLKAEIRLILDELTLRVKESKGGDFYDPSTKRIYEAGENAVAGDRASAQTREPINEPPQVSASESTTADRGPASGSPDIQALQHQLTLTRERAEAAEQRCKELEGRK